MIANGHKIQSARCLGEHVASHPSETGAVLQLAVDLVLVPQLRASCAVLLKLDCHLLAVLANAQVDVAKATTANTSVKVGGQSGRCQPTHART